MAISDGVALAALKTPGTRHSLPCWELAIGRSARDPSMQQALSTILHRLPSTKLGKLYEADHSGQCDVKGAYCITKEKVAESKGTEAKRPSWDWSVWLRKQD